MIPAALLLASLPAGSLIEGVELEGHGAWAMGFTDTNPYQVGSPRGSYDSFLFTAGFTATPVEDLEIKALSSLIMEPGVGGVVPILDAAYASWRFTDWAVLAAGRMTHPFGLYGEYHYQLIDAAIFTLPVGFYGNAGFFGYSYNGLQLSGGIGDTDSWGVDYYLYGGWMEVGDVAFDFSDPDVDNVFYESLKHVIGARASLHTPLQGLSANLSGYTGTNDDNEQRPAFAVGLSYGSDSLSVRVEGAYRVADPDAIDFYAEADYRFLTYFQVAGRFDWMDLVPRQGQNRILMHHQEIAGGLSVWLTDHLALRLSYHNVTGNRFARPRQKSVFIAQDRAGKLESQTQMLLFGATFSTE